MNSPHIDKDKYVLLFLFYYIIQWGLILISNSLKL